MPNYNFLNLNTNEEFTDFMTNSAREQFLADNPHIQQIPSLTAIGDSVRLGLKKPDQGFRDVLNQVKKSNYKSRVNSW
jgi:hypothetical protein